MSVNDEIEKLQRQGKILRTFVLYGIALVAFTVVAAWWGFDTGQRVQAKADVRKVLAWAASAEIPTVQETRPGNVPVAIIQDGYCRPYPQHLPAAFRVAWVAPGYEPCDGQTDIKPTGVSPALAKIEEGVK